MSTYTKPQNSTDIEQVRACALRLLARREHARAELEQKLIMRHFPESLIKTVIDSLEKQGWQSDLRFATAYVAEQIQRGYGMLKIEVELKKRGITKDIIATVLPLDPVFWQQQLSRIWNNTGKLTRKTYPQQMRFLQSRGFTWQQINDRVPHNEQ